MHSETKISNDDIAHHDGGKYRKAQNGGKAADVPCNVKVAIGGPTTRHGWSPSPPQYAIGAEQDHQRVRRNALRVYQHFVPEDCGERSLKGISHWVAVGKLLVMMSYFPLRYLGDPLRLCGRKRP